MSENPLIMADRIRNAVAMGESHFREFKSAMEGPAPKKRRSLDTIRRDIAETLVAFANADGGELLIGVEDDGVILGVPHSRGQIEAMLRAPEELVHSTTPLSGVRRATADIDGKAVIYFSVGKSTEYVHQTAAGRCVRRLDIKTVPAIATALKSDRQEESSRKYDREYVDGARVNHLDLDLLSEAAKLVAPGATPEMLIQQLEMGDFSKGMLRLRRGALLLFAKDISRWHPRCAVRFLHVDGAELRTGTEYNVIIDRTITLPIVRLIPASWDLLRPYLSRTALAASGRFEETILFPEDACREAIVNAIAHRDYSAEGRLVEIYVFSDRVELTSPGRLLQTISIDDLKRGGGVHESRNTLVARVLRELRFMREMGEGVRRMFMLMRAHDLVDPEFVNKGESFTVKLDNRSVYSEEALRWLEGYKPFSLTREEQQVVLLCSHGKPVSPSQVMAALGKSGTDQYAAIYTDMQRKGLIYSTLSKAQVYNLAQKNHKKQRDLPRVMVRTPAEALTIYDDLLGALRASVASFPLTRATIGDVRIRLNPESTFASSDGSLLQSLRAFELIDDAGNPSPKLSADFRAYGIDMVGVRGKQKAKEAAAYSSQDSNARKIFEELFSASNALGVELTLQTAGNRLRARLGPERYQKLVREGGLRLFVESLGHFVVVEDHGRHVVQLAAEHARKATKARKPA